MMGESKRGREYKQIVKQEKKRVEVEIWGVNAEEFPLKLSMLKPIFHVLSFAQKNISKINDFLFCQRNNLDTSYFPVQMTLPLFLSLKAVITFSDITLRKLNPAEIDFDLDQTLLK